MFEGFPIVYGDYLPPVRGQICPQGHEWHNLCRGPSAIVTYQKSKLWASGFKEEDVLVFPIISLR